MKQALFILMLLGTLHSRAQEVFRLPEPDGSLYELKDNFVYRMGDFPDARFPGFDDRSWKPIRPAADIHDSIPADVKNGIGWMRLRFRVSKETIRMQLALLVHQTVASEIYLNGELIRKYGSVSTDPALVKAFDPRWEPLPLQFSGDSFQLLAVRFVVQPGLRYTTFYGNTSPFLSLSIMEYGAAVERYKGIYQRPWIDTFMEGIIFMVFILHLSFFLMYPVQRANLLFSMFALFNLIGSLFHQYFYYGARLEYKFALGILLSVVYGISQSLMIASVYRYMKIRPDILFKIFVGFVVFSILAGAFWYWKGFLIVGTMPVITYLIVLSIAYQAWKRQIRESVILLVGFGIAVISFLLFLASAARNPMDHRLVSLWDIKGFIFLFNVIGPPAAMSIFLAYDFAKTSRTLGAKLAEVETLSERNLSIEKEKQDILSTQNQELEARVRDRTAALTASLHELKTTQAQLIQSEKMASLGELTAGIAHEIQNPLNFVNNFSEVNADLADELLDAATRGDMGEIKAIATDIRSNQQKISEHGKRADGIVKSMLQHSRSSSGEKEPTDLNALAEEYLRLAFHGFKAKDKSFNVKVDTDFDARVGSIPIVPQEIGRVILNLLNNAFYAVDRKSKAGNDGYTPKVTIRTKRQEQVVVIEVEDNGDGIPAAIRDKIFQPFFTTKPTGQGTGLGLSLSYDIVRKLHGGEMYAESGEGQGTTLRLILPIAKT